MPDIPVLNRYVFDYPSSEDTPKPVNHLLIGSLPSAHRPALKAALPPGRYR
jgi:hypothetical protein